MRNLSALVLAVALSVTGIFQATPAHAGSDFSEWGMDKMTTILKDNLKLEGNFAMALFPYHLAFSVADNHPKWQQKRMKTRQMIKEIQKLNSEHDKHIVAILMLTYRGGFTAKGKTDMKVPDDLRDYIFIDNDVGVSVKCSQAEIPLLQKNVSMIQNKMNVVLMFPKKNEDKKSILTRATKLTFTVGGLGFKDNKFSFELPFEDLVSDMPAEMKNLMVKAKAWKEPSGTPKQKRATKLENLQREKARLLEELKRIEKDIQEVSRK